MNKSDFKSLLELAQSIEQKSADIQQGKYGLEELEWTLNELNELQERLIILKYKAIERLSKPKDDQEPDTEETVQKEGITETTNTQDNLDSSNGNQMTIMDGIKQEESINEKLAPDDKSIAERMEEGSIEDLKKAISLNDKFTFIRQLFAEDHAAYEEVIKKLDKASDKDEAIVTINEVMVKFSWEEEDDAVQKFRDLIDRKFGE